MFLNCSICLIFLLIFIVIIYNIIYKSKTTLKKPIKLKKNNDWYPGTPEYEEYKE